MFTKLMRRSMAYLLLLAMLVSLVPNVFAAEEDTGSIDFSDLTFDVPDELETEEVVVASFDENGNVIYEPASDEVRSAVRLTDSDGNTILENRAGTDFAKGQRLAFFLDPSNSEGNSNYTSYSLTATIVKNLVAAGVTDLFVMTKNKAGTFSLTDLKTANSNKGSAKVYAWMHCAIDDAYLKSNKNAGQYHFRAGFNNSQNGGDTSVSGFVNLGYASYITYMEGLVGQATSYADGLLLDSVRFGTEYTGWGQEARDYMGKTNYNNAVKAMCATAYEQYGTTYRYKADDNGYYAYVSSGGSTNTSGSTLEDLISADNAATTSLGNYRKSVITNFIGKMKAKFGSSKIIAVALEKDWTNTNYFKFIKGQDPYNFRSHVSKGFCVTMQVGTDYHSTAPVTMAKQVAKYTNVMIGVDFYKVGTVGNYGYTVPDTIVDIAESIYTARYDVNGNYKTYRGCILGAACYTAGHVGAVKVVLSGSGTTPTLTATIANPNQQTQAMLSYFNAHGDTDCGTQTTDGSKIILNGTMQYFANITSSGNGAYGYIGSYADYTGAVVSAFGAATIQVKLKNYTVDWDKLPFARIALYVPNSLSTYLDCVGHFPIYYIKGHESCSSFNTKVLSTATCTTNGYTLYTCKTCGYDYVAATSGGEHSYTSSVTTQPTCTAAGVKTYTCSRCSNSYTEAVAATGHSYTSAVTAPTCTAGGYTTYTCSTCKNSYQGDAVAATGHSYVSTTVGATCTTGGYTSYTCSVCNDTYTDNAVDPLGHSYTENVIAPTCLEGGYTSYACPVCGDVYIDNLVNALGHDYRGTIALDPTCTEEGVMAYTCAHCGDNYREALPLAGHTYGSETIAPTCTTNGYTVYTCFDCGHSYQGDEVKKTGHNHEATVTPPTCTDRGYTTYVCINEGCNDSYVSNYVAATGHNYDLNVVEPTCTEIGYTEFVCACGDSFISDYIAATGHSYVYTDNGENHTVTCKNCNYSATEDHKVENYTCTLCSALLCKHESTKIVVDVQNTCTSEGSQRTVCTACGLTLSTETTAALGHKPVQVPDIAPTCTDEGSRAYWTCENCGGYYTDASFSYALPPAYVIIAATGHSYGQEVTAPTCTDAGYTKYTCSSCGDSYTSDETEALGHTEAIDAAVAPTCYTTGLTEGKHCSVCSQILLAQEEVAALEHAFEDQACIHCGLKCYTVTIQTQPENNMPEYTRTDIAYEGEDYVLTFEVPEGSYVRYANCKLENTAFLEEELNGNVLTISADQITGDIGICVAFAIRFTIDSNGAVLADPSYAVPEQGLTDAGFDGWQFYNATMDMPYIIETISAVYRKPGYVVAGLNTAADGSGTDYSQYDGTFTSDVVVYIIWTPCDHEGGWTDATCTEIGGCSVCALTVEATGHSHTYTENGENHVIGCENCDYSVAEDHTYTDGTCICGAKEVVEPKYEYNSNLGMTMNISVGAEMQVMYTILNARVKNFESFYVEVVKDVVGAESVKTVFSLDNGNMDEMFAPNGNLVGYTATYTGIFAMEMGDNFTATLYAVAEDGTIYYGDSETASIKTYLMQKLADATSSDTLKTLAVDMLNYGAAAQVNFNYDAENLVNADLTDEQKALGTQELPSATDSSATAGDGGIITTSVSLQSKVLLYINCSYAKTENSNLEFVVKDLNGDVLERFAPTVAAAKICQGVYGNVGASQMRDLITIELYDNGVLVSQTLTWNIESYVAQTRKSAASSEALIATVNAMLVYGDSAAAYFSESGQ